MLRNRLSRRTSASLWTLLAVIAVATAFFFLRWQGRTRAQVPSQGVAFTRLTMGPIPADTTVTGASWADYDNDGDLDLFTVGANPQQRRVLYRNDGQDVFTRLVDEVFGTQNFASLGASWADYDNDGDLDVVLAGSPTVLLRNEGNGSFTRARAGDLGASDARGWSPAWGDYDNDGNVDLYITHPAGFVGPATPSHLFHNSGPPNYTFTKITEGVVVTKLAPYTSGNWSDFDQDGDLDLFVGSGPANGTLAPDYFYRNLLKESDSATFERITDVNWAAEARDGQVANWIDYDNDGDLDLYITNWGGVQGGLANDLYRNDGGGTFTKITDGAIATDVGVSLANIWGDFDNDGDLDAFVANAGGAAAGPLRADKLYLNNGDGTFTPAAGDVIDAGLSNNWAATVGDYDNDGDLDLVVPGRATTDTHAFYRNDTANGNHWLKINAVGVMSNRSAIGAKARVRATINGQSVWQIREISSQDSFLGHNSLDVHFGLGDAAIVEMLVIEWPSGRRDEFPNVAANQFIRVTEGGSLTKIE